MKNIIYLFIFSAGIYIDLHAQQFTKVVNDPIVMDQSNTLDCSWGDYDHDGDMDLFVVTFRTSLNNLFAHNLLYQNNCNGSFTKVIAIPGGLVQDGGISLSGGWVDYNSDGYLDLYVANSGGQDNFLYTNNGDGTFVKTNNLIAGDGGNSRAVSWADYDNDGNLDLFVANDGRQNNFLYANQGNGQFTKITTGVIVNDGGRSTGAVWGDYDNDGDMDLFVANAGVDFLYRNEGSGTFTRIIGQVDGFRNVFSASATWVDYDNDLDLDLFVSNSFGRPLNFLYNNNGNGTFTRILTGTLATDRGNSEGGNAWGDFDNDGDLDLFLADLGQNKLFINQGNGNFVKDTTSVLVNENPTDETFGSAWIDYDSDGDLDLYAANAFFGGPSNYFYRNNGNNNHWITLACKGTQTNRMAVGTRVYVKATIDGIPTWQMREITATTAKGGGAGGVNATRLHFGLGDATVIDTLKIVWPTTNTVQEFNSIPVDQFLEITEGGSLTSNIVNIQPCLPDLPPENAGSIQGTVYNDLDDDCMFDPGIGQGPPPIPIITETSSSINIELTSASPISFDTKAANVLIQAQPGPYYGLTGANGDYEISVPSGDYLIAPFLDGNDVFDPSCPDPDTAFGITITSGGMQTAEAFGLSGGRSNCDLDISLLYPQLGGLCQGDTFQYCATFTNNGPDITLSSWGVGVSPTWYGGNTLNSCLGLPSGILLSGQSCQLCFLVNVPAAAMQGDILSLRVYMCAFCENELVCDTVVFLDTVDCAPEDPNDKLLLAPEACGPLGVIQRDHALTYQVRFQNVGDAPAVNVMLRDELAEELDLSTFEILGSSHDITNVQIIPDNALIITFEHIILPTETADSAGSNGFVLFRIKPKPDLSDGTPITNQVAIFFDQNEAVITNTTLNTLVESPIPDADFEVRHACNNTGLTYDFFYLGTTPDLATFNWNFGPNAMPPTSTEQNPAGITYASEGIFEATLTIERFGCTASTTKTVEVTDVFLFCENADHNDSDDSSDDSSDDDGKEELIVICHTDHENNNNSDDSSSSDDSEESSDDDSEDIPEKETICIHVNDLAEHLQHGDCLGPCPGIQNKKGQNDGYPFTVSKESIWFIVQPNPSSHYLNIEFKADWAANAQLELYNSMGQKVAGLFNGVLTKGENHKLVYKHTHLPPGVYFLKLDYGKELKLHKIVLIDL